MTKRKLGLAALVLALGIAAAPGAYAAGISTPGQAFSPVGENVEAVRFCPIRIFCVRGRVARCHYSPYLHRCVCRCVPRGPIGIKPVH
jgi:hypothetical protein